MATSGIYKITNNTTGEFYIGSSVNTTRRMGVHKSQLRGNYHPNSHLQKSWNKYGELAFEFSIIDLCCSDAAELISREQYYIDTLQPKFNMLTVAHSFSGYHHTEQAREKIGKANKGNKHALGYRNTEEQRKAKSVRMAGRKMSPEFGQKVSSFQKGRVKSDEEKRKISATLKGRKLPQVTKDKMSAMRKGRIVSPETKEKIRLGLLGNKCALGSKRSDETKKKMSESRLAYFERKRKVNLDDAS